MIEARRLRALLGCTTALTALAVMQPARAQAPMAVPTGGSVVAGSASIAEAPGAATITQATPRAAINWQSFDVGSKATVTFRQPSSQAVTLNRVTAPDPSLIAGHINANGSIVLVNPDGIVFAHGAEVNAAGLVASAPGITNQNFMAGRMIFNQPAHPDARVVNQGKITIGQAGLAALVAPTVANSGVIAAKLGSVVLAGARTATLDLYGDGLVSIDVAGAVKTVPVGPDGKQVKALVTNIGTIVAEGGTVLLTAKAVDGLIQNLVDAGGTISANGVSGQPAGTVLVQGVGGSITIAGTLTASGKGIGGTGGAIGLDATGEVAVAKTARIDASGPAGGGVVAVGTTLARAKGGPGTPAGLTATNVQIAPGATISADATASGNGGRVTVLSTADTADHGAITAEGGPKGGNGGFVEVSGHDLALDGTVNTSAPLGATGTILLDPTDLTILVDADNDNDIRASIPFGVNGVAWQVNGDEGSDTVSPGALEALFGNVTLQATNTITFASNLALTGPGQSLLVQAGNSIIVDPGIAVSATGNIEMDASSTAIPGHVPGGQLLIQGEVTAGGNVSLSAGTGGIIFGDFSGVPGHGNVSANDGAGTLAVNTTGGVDQFSGVVTAGTLTGTANFFSVPDGNVVGTLGAFTLPTESELRFNDTEDLTVAGPVSAAGGFIELSTTGNLTIAGPVNAAREGFFVPSVTLFSGGNMVFAGEVNASGGTVAITADGGITEPGGAVLANILGGTSGGAALFTGVNTIGTLANVSVSSDPPPPGFTAGGNFTLVDSAPLIITAPIIVPAGHTIALVTDSLTEGSQTFFDSFGSQKIFGALEAPGGEVSIAPFTPSVPVALVGAGPQPTGTLSLDDALLAAITAGTLALTSFGTEPITISGANQLGGLKDPNTGAASGVSTLSVKAGGVFGEAAGASLNVGALAGSAGSVALNETNVVPALGPFASTGGFELTDSTGLTVLGSVSDPTGITLLVNSGGLAVGNASTFGQLASAGIVNLQVPNGSITVPNGQVQAGTLTGAASGLASFGTAHVVTLGSFSVSGGTGQLALTNNAPLTITGPVSAAFLDIAAPGTLTLAGNIFTTGLPLADQSGAAPSLPGSVLEVLSGGVFQQLGTSVIAPLGGGGATVRIQLPAEGGAATFANLLAGGANLVLALGPGVASGTMAAGGLLVIGTGGGANLFGSVAGIPGGAAALAARILPFVNANYRFNGCIIETTVCSSLLVQVPQGTPNLVASGGGPSLLPSVTLPPIVLFVIPAEIGESWTDAGGFPLPNIARLDF